ncbi:MAG: molybdopterin-dependent oxidoreductase [Candidatus Lokiarchaeota archaeon]|nr:molybdopterin-dependent oxidoreductase [Candidatus Lokiarchaeota archaeon]
MEISRNQKILFILLTAVIVTGISVPLILLNLNSLNNNSWTLTLKGEVSQEVSINLQDIYDETYGTAYTREFLYKNEYGTQYTNEYTGIRLWDIIQNTSIDIDTEADSFYFQGIDGWFSPIISLSDLENNPEMFIVCFKENGEFLKYKNEGGDGPLRAVVDFAITDPDPNAKYWSKYLAEIIFTIAPVE